MSTDVAPRGASWRIEWIGSEIARVEWDGCDLTMVLAAAQVRGDRRQIDPGRSGGHLQGVRCHLIGATWSGEPAALIGRIDEAEWIDGQATAQPGQASMAVPSSGATAIRLSLRTALGDTLEVQAQAWRIELLEGGRFTPSLAC